MIIIQIIILLLVMALRKHVTHGRREKSRVVNFFSHNAKILRRPECNHRMVCRAGHKNKVEMAISPAFSLSFGRFFVILHAN